jgi:hypothetical protein
LRFGGNSHCWNVANNNPADYNPNLRPGMPVIGVRESVCKLTGSICRWCDVVSQSEHPTKKTRKGVPYILYHLECGRTVVQAPSNRPRKSVACDVYDCPDHPEYVSREETDRAIEEFCSKSAEQLREEGYEVHPAQTEDVGRPFLPWSLYRSDGLFVFPKTCRSSSSARIRRSTKQ